MDIPTPAQILIALMLLGSVAAMVLSHLLKPSNKRLAERVLEQRKLDTNED